MSSSSPGTDARLILAVLAGLEVDHLGAAPGRSDQRAIRAVLERLFQGLSALWLAERT
jgi:TetR/AcrR family transcriptional regulator, regulator of biofilm formation and stress response